ncbi:PTS transporter subunit EIIC [Thermoanaerobacterium sp. RBIITD]|uniref:PTS sugar transporter subunit IIC n=1 Tax=Thermoanaerobacterium sp. RBIITD TaxID=1550240 RepID=UPI000BB67E57|nr:PTS transporter subunit EIIC [Thermoanaerobacterium sp. RBIITD]SNX53326.1 PTS system, cellobiose-specific IIC component [Thermoanaerobacterium sp. RBIITD]
MEHLLESKFMIKLQDFGQKLGRNKFLTALQGAMMSLTGIIMVGAIFQILSAVGSESMLNLFSTKSKIYSILYLPYQFTMNSLSLWVVAILAYNYAKNLKMKSPIMNAVDALVSFLLVSGTLITNKQGITGIDMTYLGAQGMFIGFAVVFISVHIEKFCADKNIRIKMPDVVPQFLQDGFASILPLLFSVIFFLTVSTIVSAATGGAYNVPSGFMKVLGIPLNVLISVPGMFILGIFAALLWCFGIHGSMIVFSVVFPLLIQAAVSNAALHQAGKPLVFYPVVLFGAISIAGGTGNTLPLVLMGLKSKSKQICAVSKIALVPGWFNINEPVTFGMPIMYNPILCIPYVLNIPVVMLCTYLGYKFGFLQPQWIPIFSLLPMGFGNYLGTLRWQNAIWDYLMLIPSAIVWYPFFKIYERQLVAKEKAAALEEAKYE